MPIYLIEQNFFPRLIFKCVRRKNAKINLKTLKFFIPLLCLMFFEVFRGISLNYIQLEVWFHYFVVFNFNFINPCTWNIYQTFYEEKIFLDRIRSNFSHGLSMYLCVIKMSVYKGKQSRVSSEKMQKFSSVFCKIFREISHVSRKWMKRKKFENNASMIYLIILCTEISVLKVLWYHNQ